MITWLQHNAYSRELKTLRKTTRSIEKDIEKVKRLLVAHFYTEQTKGSVINPGKIHRITVDNDVTSIDFNHRTINLCGADIIKFEDGTLIQCVRTKR